MNAPAVIKADQPQSSLGLPVLPRNFDELTKGLAKEAREAKRRELQAEFVTAKGELRRWIMADRDSAMTAVVKLIAIHLLECVNFETGLCNPSFETIADTLSIHRKSVERAFPILQRSGWLKAISVGRNQPYRIVFIRNEEKVKFIDELLLTNREARKDRRENKRFSRLIDHMKQETAQSVTDKMSLQTSSCDDNLSPPDASSCQSEYRKGTQKGILSEEGNESKEVLISYATARDGDDVPIHFENAEQVEDAVQSIASERQLLPSDLSKLRQFMKSRPTPRQIQEFVEGIAA